MAGPGRTAVGGSAREPLPGARRVADLAREDSVQVTLRLRRRQPLPAETASALATRADLRREHWSHAQLVADHGASGADVEAVRAAADRAGLRVVSADRARRTVVLEGSAAAVGRTFAVTLGRYQHRTGRYRGYKGPVRFPEELATRVEAVLGLDDRPQLHSRTTPVTGTTSAGDVTPSPVTTIADAYGFRSCGTGAGQGIGIVALGGGYRDSDVQAYAARLGLSSAPTVVAVSVDGAGNVPTGSVTGLDSEVALDVQVALAVAPAAAITVYFAPNTDAGMLGAITTAVHDTTHRLSVLSISWGSAEATWTGSALAAIDDALLEAALLGVCVVAAAGDNGAVARVPDGRVHVEFPASSPYVLSCGGTRLELADQRIAREVVWNDGSGHASGGGISDTFDRPPWQASVGLPPSLNPGGRVGRGVPDVAGDADARTGYEVLVDGTWAVTGGTSAATPLYAAYLATLSASLGQRVGYLNPLLYRLAGTPALRAITVGDNGVPGTAGYRAGPGWDCCTGLGVGSGPGLRAALGALSDPPPPT